MESFGKIVASLSVTACCFLPAAERAFSQDEDFFGGNLGGSNAVIAENDSSLANRAIRTAILEERDPVVRSLLIDPPITPLQLGKALKLMVRIKRFDEVGRWLESVRKLELDEPTALDLVSSAGVRTFSIIAETESIDLSKADQELALKVVTMASGATVSPKTLGQYAQQMRSSDSNTRLAGYRGIATSGRAGIQEFLGNVMAPSAAMPTPIMCEALSKLGQPAWEGWNEAIRTTHSDAQLNLAILAYGSRDPKYLAPLSAVIKASDPLDEAWAPLRKAWTASNATADSAIQKQSILNLKSTMALYQRIRFNNDVAIGLEWQLADDGRSLQLSERRPAEAVFQQLQACANTVLRTTEAAGRDSALAFAILAESLSTQQSYLEMQELIGGFKEDQSFFCTALDLAEENDLGKAQAVILEEFKRFLVPLMPEVKERLLRSLDSGYRVVRYRAASLLIDYLTSLPEDVARTSLYGRSKLDRVARELVAAKSKPVAFVVGSSSSLRSHLKSLLDAQNYLVIEYGSATELISAAKQGIAADQVFVVSNVFEVSLAQLVQRLRGVPVTSKVPILMLCDRLSVSEVESLSTDGRVVLGSVPPDAPGLLRILGKLNVVDSQIPSLTFSDRIVWSEKADRYLAIFSSN